MSRQTAHLGILAEHMTNSGGLTLAGGYYWLGNGQRTATEVARWTNHILHAPVPRTSPCRALRRWAAGLPCLAPNSKF